MSNEIPLCEKCKSFMVDLLEKRIRRTFELGHEEDLLHGKYDGTDDGTAHAEAQCFHFMELISIIQGKTTCGVYDNYGKPPNPPTITGPLFNQRTQRAAINGKRAPKVKAKT